LLLRSTPSDEVADHHHSGCNADTRLEGGVRLQVADRRDQFEPCAYGLLGVVFVRLRVSEIDEDTIAHVLRHEPTKATHGVCNALLVGRNDFAKVLRVHACRHCR